MSPFAFGTGRFAQIAKQNQNRFAQLTPNFALCQKHFAQGFGEVAMANQAIQEVNNYRVTKEPPPLVTIKTNSPL